MIDLLGLPLTSIFLLLSAGIMIGFLLWYQDRSVDTEKFNELENRFFTARDSARQSRQQLLELDQLRQEQHDTQERLVAEQTRSATLVGQLHEAVESKTALEQQFDARAEMIQQLQQVGREQESELERLRGGLSSEKKSHIPREQVKQLQTDNRKLDARARELESLLAASKQSLQQTQQDLVDRCDDLDAARAQRDQFQLELQAGEERIAMLEAEFATVNSTITNQEDNATDLKAAANSLAEQRQLLEQRESQLALANDELDQLRQVHSGATEQLDQLNSDNETLRASISQRDARIAEMGQQIEELSPLRAELDNATLELADQKAEVARHLATIERQMIDLALLQQQQQVMEQIESELAESGTQLNDANGRCQQLETELQAQHVLVDHQQAELSRMAQELIQLEPLRNELALAIETIKTHEEHRADLRARCEQQAAEIEKLELELDGRRTEMAADDAVEAEPTSDEVGIAQLMASLSPGLQDHTDTPSELKAEIESQRSALQELRRQIAERSQQHDQAAEELARALREGDPSHDDVQSPAANLADEKPLPLEQKSLKDRASDLMAQLNRMSADLADNLEFNAQARDGVRDLENQVDQQDARIHQIRRHGELIIDPENDSSSESDQRAA